MCFSDFSVKWGKLSYIFIFYYYGDYVLGLFGLLSFMGFNYCIFLLIVFGLLKVGVFLEQVCFFFEQLFFFVYFEFVDFDCNVLLYESRYFWVYSLLLCYSVLVIGYFFQEKECF